MTDASIPIDRLATAPLRRRWPMGALYLTRRFSVVNFLYMFSLVAGIGIQVPYLYVTGNLSLIDLVIIPALPVILFRHRNMAAPRPGYWFAWGLGLLAAWSLTALALTGDVALENLATVLRIFYYAAVVYAFSGFARDVVVLKRMGQFFLIGLVINVGSAVAMWSTQTIFWDGIPLLNTETLSRNVLYYYIVFGLALLLGSEGLRRRARARWAAYSMAGALTIAGFLTFSRGAWLFLLVLWTTALLTSRRRALPPLLLLLVFASVLFVGLGIEFDDLVTRVGSRLNLDTARERVSFARIAQEIGLQNPVIGVGPRNFRNSVKEFDLDLSAPHNVPLMIFAETGAVGLVIYLVLWTLILWCLLRLWRSTNKNHLLEPHRMTVTLLAGVLFGLNWVTGMSFTDKMFPFFLIYLSGTVMVYKSAPTGRLFPGLKF